jgi:uncharacterized protein YjlB
MPPAPKSIEPVVQTFPDDGVIPNNPRLPLLIHRAAIDLTGSPDPERLIEQAFRTNRWGGMWRNGIFPYVHYHSMVHETMGVARGRAKVRFGGPAGQEYELSAGDVVVLPAGTGHQCVWASRDLSVVGAYPATGEYNLCRGSRAEHEEALKTIPQVPLPESDPVFGADGLLLRLWRA